MQHKLITKFTPSGGPSSLLPAPPSSSINTWQTPVVELDIQKISETVAGHLIPLLTSKLAPAIPSNIAAGFTAIVPLTQATSSGVPKSKPLSHLWNQSLLWM